MKIKRKVTLGALYLGTALTLTSCKEKEEPVEVEIEEQILENHDIVEQKKYTLSDCQVIIENFPDGSVKHHFIIDNNRNLSSIKSKETIDYKEYRYEYKTITNENLKFSDLKIYYTDFNNHYEEIPETNGSYIFDYNVSYFKIDAKNLVLPDGYSLEEEYSVEEFKILEEKLDASLYERNEKEEYYTQCLLFAKIADEYICFDSYPIIDNREYITETSDIEDATKLKEIVYLPAIGKSTLSLKVKKAVLEEEKQKSMFSLWEDKFFIEDITSLDQTVRNDLRENVVVFQSLSNCLNYEQREKETITKEEMNEILEELNSPQHKLEEAIEELSNQNDVIEVSTYANNLWITKKDNTSPKELPKEFYEKLNALLKESDINHLYLKNIDDTILDISQIDTSNITNSNLDFTNFEGNLDCSSLKGDICVEFTNTSGVSAAEILSTCQDKFMEVNWIEDVEKKSELKNFLEGINENNINMYSLNIKERNKGNYNGLSREEFELVSKVNAERIDIDADGFKKTIDLDLELNPRIQDFDIELYEFYDYGRDSDGVFRENYINSELGNIKIQSENKEFWCSFNHTDITQNTSFLLPDATTLWLHNLNCTDIRAFKDLRNVHHLEFKEDLHTDGMADTNGEMVYDAEEMPNNVFGELLYNDFNKFLKTLEYFFKLKGLRERMNLPPGYSSSYYNETKIGAYANLESDDAEVYQSLEDLNKKRNPKSSYFGEDELRCISSICLANNEQEINANTMEEYKYYKEEGYEVIGVSFINIYATTKEDREIYVPIESVKLIRTPFE